MSLRLFSLFVLVLTSGRVKRPDKVFAGFDVCHGKYHDFGSSIYFQPTPEWNLSDSFNRRVKVVSSPQNRWTKHGHMCLYTWLLDIFLYHDLEINPDPTAKTPKCTTCTKTVRKNQAAILCDNCMAWFRIKCCGLTKGAIKNYKSGREQCLFLTYSLPQFSDSFFD